MDDNTNGIALPGTEMATANTPKAPRKSARPRRSAAKKLPRQAVQDRRSPAVQAAEDPPERVMRAGRAPDARFQRTPVREAAEPARRDQPRADGRLTRTRKRSTDPLYIDKKIIPEGYSYEFKAFKAYGEEQDAHVQGLMENHWTPVPKGRHPGLVVKHGDLVLMERPKYLTDEAKIEDYEIAVQQVDSVNGNLRTAKDGQAPRNIPALENVHKHNVTYERLAIPEE